MRRHLKSGSPLVSFPCTAAVVLGLPTTTLQPSIARCLAALTRSLLADDYPKWANKGGVAENNVFNAPGYKFPDY